MSFRDPLSVKTPPPPIDPLCESIETTTTDEHFPFESPVFQNRNPFASMDTLESPVFLNRNPFASTDTDSSPKASIFLDPHASLPAKVSLSVTASGKLIVKEAGECSVNPVIDDYFADLDSGQGRDRFLTDLPDTVLDLDSYDIEFEDEILSDDIEGICMRDFLTQNDTKYEYRDDDLSPDCLDKSTRLTPEQTLCLIPIRKRKRHTPGPVRNTTPPRRQRDHITPIRRHIARQPDPNSQISSSGLSEKIREFIDKILGHEDRGREDFLHYRRKFRKALRRRVKNVTNLRTSIRKVETKMCSELARWQKWGLLDLEYDCRTYYSTNILHRKTVLDVEMSYYKLYSGVLDDLNAIITDQLDVYSCQNLRFNDDGSFVEPKDYQLPHLVPIQRSCQEMPAVVRTLRTMYKRAKSISHEPLTVQERKEKLVTILNDAFDSRVEQTDFYWHPFDNSLQLRFNCIFIDERHKEGQQLKEWCQTMLNEDQSSRSVISFITFMTNYIIALYSFDSQLHPTIELMIYRFLFTTMPEQLNLQTDLEAHNDVVFTECAENLRKINPLKLGIPKEFLPSSCSSGGQTSSTIPESSESILEIHTILETEHTHSQLPYHDAIEHLTTLCNHTVPNDILYVFLETVRKIKRHRRIYSKGRPQEIPAKDLFPLVAWTCIHANLPHIFTKLGHIDRFIDVDKYAGEVLQCLALIEDSVLRICHQNLDVSTPHSTLGDRDSTSKLSPPDDFHDLPEPMIVPDGRPPRRRRFSVRERKYGGHVSASSSPCADSDFHHTEDSCALDDDTNPNPTTELHSDPLTFMSKSKPSHSFISAFRGSSQGNKLRSSSVGTLPRQPHREFLSEAPHSEGIDSSDVLSPLTKEVQRLNKLHAGTPHGLYSPDAKPIPFIASRSDVFEDNVSQYFERFGRHEMPAASNASISVSSMSPIEHASLSEYLKYRRIPRSVTARSSIIS